jgi:NhaP-type Na+/H+ or K+/H+ antiporter
MQPYLIDLTWFSLFLLIGIILSIVSSKIKVSDVLLLLIAGIIIGQFKTISLHPSFITGFSIFALIMIIFSSASKFRPKEISSVSPYAIKLSLVFFILAVIFLTLGVHFIFESPFTVKAFLISGLFASLMSGTSPDAVLSLLKDGKNKLIEILEFESILNTPLMILVPLVILDIYKGTLVAQHLFTTLLQSVMTGVGTGIVIGLVVFRIMKEQYSHMLSPIIIVASALITYTLAEQIGGSGILAVTALGIIYGLMAVKHKETLQEFSEVFTNFLKIMVFILLGLMIKIPFRNYDFLIKSGILFLIYILVRFIAVGFSFRGTSLGIRHKVFMGLNVSKGVAVAVVAFILLAELTNVPNLRPIIDLSFLFILYSIVLASIAEKFSFFFLKNVRV